jgi:hypothetical protein
MTMQIIETELKGRIRKDDDLKLILAKANNVKVDTVNRWLREDDVILTTVQNLAIIRNHFKLPKRHVLTVEPEASGQK